MFAATTIDTLSVIDPCNRTGKITVPMSYVTETKGVSDFIKCGGVPPPDTKDLSLCLLFQKGRCNAGARCNQVHATPAFVEGLRTRALATSTCCGRHGDVHSTALDANRVVALSSEVDTQHFSLADFAVTPSLELALQRSRGGAIRVQANRICRLHQKGSCKFGRDCKNVHLCKDARPITGPAAPTIAAPAPVVLPAPAGVRPPASLPSFHHPAAQHQQQQQPAPLGLAFRALDISSRCEHAAGADFVAPRVSRAATTTAALTAATTAAEFVPGVLGASVKPLSILSIMEEFHTTRCGARDDMEMDPLDLADVDSSCSSGPDFDAFVEGLVTMKVSEPMASPQWLQAYMA